MIRHPIDSHHGTGVGGLSIRRFGLVVAIVRRRLALKELVVKSASRCAALTLAFLLSLVSPSSALNILLDYQPENNSEDPAFDPTGDQLIDVMLAAAAHWESIILDNHDITIRFWYDDLNDSAIGSAGNLDSSANRVNIGRIKFDTRDTNNQLRDWWFDPTPSDDSEFTMQHMSYATDGDASWFGTAPMGGVEIGYRGDASSGPASENHDVFSTAVHEIGHLLGLINGLSAVDTEVLDGDYDLPPGLMNGDTASVRTAEPPPYDEVNEYAHIRPSTALMCNVCASTGTRRRPSAIDILAVSSIGNWTNIDLPRKMLVLGNDFNDANGWLDGQAPGNFDDAFLTDGGEFLDPIELTANDSVGSLTVNDTYFSTAAYELFVNRTTTVSNSLTSIWVPTGGQLTTQDLVVDDSGYLLPKGGTVVVTNEFTIGEDGSVQGHGTISVYNDGRLRNNNAIRVSDGVLTLTTPQQFGLAALDLDGDNEDGDLEAIYGDLLVKRPLTDTFDGNLLIGHSRTATFERNWQLGSGGLIRLTGAADIATLAGNQVTIQGNITVNQTAQILGPAILESTATVNFSAGAPPTLRLGDTTTYRGPSFAGAGRLIQTGDAVVESATTIPAEVDYDWDGDAPAPSDTAVNATSFTIHSTQIDQGDPALDGYDGSATLTDAALEVNTTLPWRLDGSIDLVNSFLRGTGILNHGTISGDGTVLPLDLTNDGSLAGDGGTLTVAPRNFPDLDGAGNNGAIRAVLGDVHVTGYYGALFPFQGILSTATDHEYRMDSFGLDNQGQIAMSGGKYVAPQLEQNGTLTVRQDTSTLETSSIFQPGSSTLLLANLVIDGAATFHSAASVTGDSTLVIAQGSIVDGEGNVEVDVSNAGTLAPGFSPGIFFVDGDYLQTSQGTLLVELGGLMRGDEFDALVATEMMRLAGTLDVDLWDDFAPAAGDEFDILDWGTLVGSFDTLDLPALGPGLVWDTSNLLFNGELAVAAGLPGDYNDDGIVDGADYTVWRDNMDNPSFDLPNEGDTEGTVTEGDFVVWRDHFGETGSGAGSGAMLVGATGSASATVPEPASATLLALAAVGASLLARRR